MRKTCKNCINMDIYEMQDDPAEFIWICSENVDGDVDGGAWLFEVNNFDARDCLDFISTNGEIKEE